MYCPPQAGSCKRPNRHPSHLRLGLKTYRAHDKQNIHSCCFVQFDNMSKTSKKEIWKVSRQVQSRETILLLLNNIRIRIYYKSSLWIGPWLSLDLVGMLEAHPSPSDPSLRWDVRLLLTFLSIHCLTTQSLAIYLSSRGRKNVDRLKPSVGHLLAHRKKLDKQTIEGSNRPCHRTC